MAQPLTLTEMADEAQDYLDKIEQAETWCFNSTELAVLEDIFEFVIQQAEKRERRRDRKRNSEDNGEPVDAGQS
jgi:hypothetical protein